MRYNLRENMKLYILNEKSEVCNVVAQNTLGNLGTLLKISYNPFLL